MLIFLLGIHFEKEIIANRLFNQSNTEQSKLDSLLSQHGAIH